MMKNINEVLEFLDQEYAENLELISLIEKKDDLDDESGYSDFVAENTFIVHLEKFIKDVKI